MSVAFQDVDISDETRDYLLSLSAKEIVADRTYIGLVNSLDTALLEHTLPQVRAAYEKMLPEFQKQLFVQYGINRAPMFSSTLGNWIISIAQYPHYLTDLVNMHHNVPREAIIGGLPLLLEMLDHTPEASKEWKRALVVLTLPLMLK